MRRSRSNRSSAGRISIRRIGLLFEYPTLNGGERSMLAALDSLRAANGRNEFVAVAPREGPLAQALAARGIPRETLAFRDCGSRRLPRGTVLTELRNLTARLRLDLLHANSLAMGRLTGALGDAFPIPRIAHVRDILRLSAAAVRDLNRNDRIVCVSNATRNFHVEQGLDAARSAVVYNGVDCEVFQPREPPTGIRDELGIPEDAFPVLTVGQIGLRKGQEVLAEAAVRLRDAVPELHFLIVGQRLSAKRESIEFERRIVRRFRDAGMAGRLHTPGYRDDVPRLMNTAELLVHPAHQEPLGRVLLEAAASGLPIIATDVGGTREILEGGVSAALVPPGDPERLAESIQSLLRSPETRRRYAVAARTTIESRFAVRQAAANLEAVWGDHV